MDLRLRLIDRLVDALPDRRSARHVEHSLADLLRQRVFQIALGYEDCNDASTLRHDPMLKACCGRDPEKGADLASQPTLSRWENAADRKTCYRFAEALLDSYISRKGKCPRRLVLDLDLTDDPTHGQQEFAFFHAYYGGYVYLPLLIFDENGDIVTAVLLPGKPGERKVFRSVLERIVERLRGRWPKVEILVRADSGFAGPPMYQACQTHGLHFIFGIRANPRLQRLAARLQERACRKFLRTGEKARLFTSVRYRARQGWPRSYRVIIKAEHNAIGPNLRFLVTDLPGRAGEVYDRYAERGESSENSIKDLKNALRADRLSCRRFLANQFRLLLHAAAYALMFALRRLAHGTELAEAQMDTLRLRLLKIGAQVRGSARRIWFHLSSAHPWQTVWAKIAALVLAPAPSG
jgi:hypothetical protein